MIEIAIVEDCEEDRKRLLDYFKKWEDETDLKFQLHPFVNAVVFLSNYKPIYDIVLMDIEMPQVNGMDAAKKLREIDSSVNLLFVTNMAQYAVKGYSVNAFDFLVKPVVYGDFKMRLNQVVNKVKKERPKDVTIHAVEGTLIRLAIDEINYISVRSHRLTYHTEKGEFIVRGNIGQLEKEYVPYGFLRSNNCYLVNPRHISFVGKNFLRIGDDELLISRGYRKSFLEALANYFDQEL